MAKKVWRSMDLDLKDDVKSTLALMMCLDAVPQSITASHFRRNLMVGESGDLRALALEQVSGASRPRLQYHRKCFALYDQIVNGVQPSQPAYARH